MAKPTLFTYCYITKFNSAYLIPTSCCPRLPSYNVIAPGGSAYVGVAIAKLIVKRSNDRQKAANLIPRLSMKVSFVCWYYLKRDNGKLEKRFVLSTKQLKGSTITWWGRRRWQIEGWFKTAKHRFGLHRFGQGTLLGVDRWLVLSLIAYLLAHWAYLSTATTDLPDWGQAAQLALQVILPQLLLFLFLLELERMRPLALSYGIYIQLSRCNI